MTAEANPKRVHIGDPITIKAAISGRWNFDRMDAPELSDERGWHNIRRHQISSRMTTSELAEPKTFELWFHLTGSTNVPPLAFSYFDPVKEKYVTLHSEAEPLIVEEMLRLPPQSLADFPVSINPARPWWTAKNAGYFASD